MWIFKRAWTLFALLCTATAAVAHTGDHSTATTGFADGFLHPWTGLDHLLAMFAVGVWSFCQRDAVRWYPPAAFIAGMTIGAVLGRYGVLPSVLETVLAVSVVALGMAIATQWRPVIAAGLAVCICAGVAHGCAHGAELSGLRSGVGMLLGTATLHLLGLLAARTLYRTHVVKFRNGMLLRMTGASIGGVGCYLLFAS